MKKLVLVTMMALLLGGGWVVADTADEVRKAILDANASTKQNLKGQDQVSKSGSIEFWSSGGLMQEIPAGEPVEEFEKFNLTIKHLRVTTLVEGQAAVAHFYMEGSVKRKGLPAVGHYMTRAMQVWVKEGDSWKIRAAHWSPIAAGAGTVVTALD
jgi:hypothetical protein